MHDCASERLLDQAAPRFLSPRVSLESFRQFVFGPERLKHGVPDLLCEYARQLIKFLECVVLRFVSGQLKHGSATLLFRYIAHQQTIILAIAEVRRKRTN